MGKEKKIGLAVLAILFVVFGAVVLRRLTRPAEETSAAADAIERPSGAGKAETAVDDARSANSAATASKPTVLPAMKLSGRAARRTPDDVTSQWITANDTTKKSSNGEASAASDAPPAAMPGPPTPSADAGYAGLGDVRQIPPPPASAAAAQTSPSDASALAPAKEAVDPFRAHAERPVTAAAPGGAPAASPPGYASPVDSYSAASSQSNSPAGRDRYASSSSAYPSSPRDPYSAAAPSPPNPDRSRDSYSATWSSPAPEAGRTSSRGAAGSAEESDFTAAARPRTARSGNGPVGNSYEAESSSRAGGTYEVQPNDTFWLISQKVYGSGAYFKALAEQNRGKVAARDKLRVGETISTPTIAQLEQAFPELCPKPAHRESARSRASLASTRGGYAGQRSYEVQEGDTLFDIARNELGKASRWAEIYELNRDALGKDFDYLTPGMQLILPPKDAPAPIDKTTRRSGSEYDR
jgi:nucleoid-associated protein YgaU